MKILITNLGLTNTTFNEYLMILNWSIGFYIEQISISFLLQFYYGFSEQYHIFELPSLFATFKLMKFVKFLMYAVVQNSYSKHFDSNALPFQITL